MTDLTIFPAHIAEMSVNQLAKLTPAQKREVDVNLDPRVRHQMSQVIDSYRARFKLATTKGSTGRLESVF